MLWTVYTSGVPDYRSSFLWGRDAQNLVVSLVFWRLLFSFNPIVLYFELRLQIAPLVLRLQIKPGDKSWMRTGLDYDYDKRKISVVICDIDIPQQLTKSW
jgi:hypothetical protein